MGEKYCEVCTINVAVMRDTREFRNIQNAPDAHEFIVCGKCSRLNNFWFARLWRANDKERVLTELLEGPWENWAAHRDDPQ
jgi:hypothetical protein